MFPTISSLLNYLFGSNLYWPIPTFGFFVALAFILSYLTFYSEFKRKEQEGVIKPFVKIVDVSRGATLAEFLEYGILGFLIGYKFFGALLYPDAFLLSPLKFIFSLQGSIISAILLSAFFCWLIYWLKNKEKLEV